MRPPKRKPRAVLEETDAGAGKYKCKMADSAHSPKKQARRFAQIPARAGRLGLSALKWETLHIIGCHATGWKGCTHTISNMARCMRRPRENVSRAISALIEQGLLERFINNLGQHSLRILFDGDDHKVWDATKNVNSERDASVTRDVAPASRGCDARSHRGVTPASRGCDVSSEVGPTRSNGYAAQERVERIGERGRDIGESALSSAGNEFAALIAKQYREIASKRGLPLLAELPPYRRRSINQRKAAHGDEAWPLVLAALERPEIRAGKQIDFEWLLRPKNFEFLMSEEKRLRGLEEWGWLNG